jgi:hypothetical protein
MSSLVGTRRSNGDLLLRTISRKRVIFRPKTWIMKLVRRFVYIVVLYFGIHGVPNRPVRCSMAFYLFTIDLLL